MENTSLFKVEEMANANVKMIIKEVKEILTEKGDNAVNQIVGYLMSGDPGYISNYKGAREKITSIDRAECLSFILKEYLK